MLICANDGTNGQILEATWHLQLTNPSFDACEIVNKEIRFGRHNNVSALFCKWWAFGLSRRLTAIVPILLLIASALHAAIPPISTFDPEVRIWAKVRVPAQTNTVTDAEYSMATEFMLFLKQKGLRQKIKRCGIYLGSGLESCRAPFIIDFGGTNDLLRNFVESDYTTNGLTGNTTTKSIGAVDFGWSFTTINSMHEAFYNRTATTTSGQHCMGMSDGTLGPTQLIIGDTTGTYVCMGGGSACVGATDNNGVGFYLMTRTATNFSGTYKNGTLHVQNTNPGGTSPPGETLEIHARNAGGTIDSWTSRQGCFYSAGTGMSAADDTAYYRTVQRLQVRRLRGL